MAAVFPYVKHFSQLPDVFLWLYKKKFLTICFVYLSLTADLVFIISHNKLWYS